MEENPVANRTKMLWAPAGGSVPHCFHPWGARIAAVAHTERDLGWTIDDSLRYPCSHAIRCFDDGPDVERRRGVYQLRRSGRRTKKSSVAWQRSTARPAPPGALASLKDLGFNLLSLADNHAWDLEIPGIQNTLKEVDRLNLAHAGTGNTLDEAAAPGYLRTPKGTVALVAMASGLIPPGGGATAAKPGVNELDVEAGNKPNEGDAQRILQSIRDASKRADLVIVYQHNHIYTKPFHILMEEELPERLRPPDWIQQWAHAEVDAGADIVVMHGAPLVQGVEVYRSRPIFYDLGNFIFQLPPSQTVADEPIVWESVIAYVNFRGKDLQSIEFRPIVLNKLGQGYPDTRDEYASNLFLQTRGLPTPATGEQARYILERLVESSQPFGTIVDLKGDTAEVHLKGRN